MEKTLKIAFFIALVGILILLLLTIFTSPDKKQIKELSENSIFQNVIVSGKIQSIKNYKTFQVIILNDSTGIIPVTIDKNLNLSKTDSIKVTGKVTKYKENIQISAEKIIKLSK